MAWHSGQVGIRLQQYLHNHPNKPIIIPGALPPMFLDQDPKSAVKRLGYKGLHRTVKQLGAIAGVEKISPHRFRHTFGTEVTRRGVDPLFGKELMGIKSDRVFQRYTKGVFKQAAARAYLEAIGESSDDIES
ncbi:MAG: site-specific integrase [Elainellaceae cyanobacterium]